MITLLCGPVIRKRLVVTILKFMKKYFGVCVKYFVGYVFKTILFML